MYKNYKKKSSFSAVFSSSSLHKAIQNNTLGIPEDEKLPDSDKVLPYCFIGDEAFPLSNHMMRPFGKADLNREHRAFNVRFEIEKKLNFFRIIFHIFIN